MVRRAIEFVIVISGSLGQQEIENISKLKNLKAVIVFCFNIEKHSKWAEKYSVVKAVVNNEKSLETELLKHFAFFPEFT